MSSVDEPTTGRRAPERDGGLLPVTHPLAEDRRYRLPEIDEVCAQVRLAMRLDIAVAVVHGDILDVALIRQEAHRGKT